MSLFGKTDKVTGHSRGVEDEPTQPHPDVVIISALKLQEEVNVPVATNVSKLTERESQEFPWEIPDMVLEIDMQFLTAPFPAGLNFSQDCDTWLMRIGVETWDDLLNSCEECSRPVVLAVTQRIRVEQLGK